MIGFSEALLMAGGIFAFTGALFTLLQLKRPSSEHLLSALLCIASASLSLSVALDTSAAEPSLAVRLSLLGVCTVLAQSSLTPTLLRKWPATSRWLSAAAAGWAAVDGWGIVAAGTVLTVTRALGVAAALFLTASLARAYVGGRRELGGVIFGAGVLGITLAKNAVLPSPRCEGFTAIGLLVLVAGLVARLVLEHHELRQRLDARKRELRTRTRELRHSHDELRAAQAALSRNEQLAAVGELAAVVAHEVRNPLAVLGNAVSSLRKEALASDDRALLLEIIESEASRLNRIVTDLLSFARPVTLQRAVIKVGDLVERALALATPKKDVKVDLHQLAGARVWADGNLLRQVFDNLIENAIQAMEAGGTLTVRIRRAGTEIGVDIIDTGEGMDTQVRKRAKDPFFTTRPSGTGLGLAIVDRIVEAHGGTLEIESGAGLGTKVSILLPEAASEPPSSRPSFEPLEGPAVGASDEYRDVLRKGGLG